MALYDDTLRNLMALLDQDSSSNRSLIFRHLCDLIVQGRPIAQGHQRAGVLALITRVLPSVEPLARMEVAELLCALSHPPVDLAIILARDDITVARWILDHARFTDNDWLKLIPKLDQERLTRLAKREGLSPTVREAVLDALDPSNGQLSHTTVAATESQIQDMLDRLHRLGASAREMRHKSEDREEETTVSTAGSLEPEVGRAAHLFAREESPAPLKPAPLKDTHHPSIDPRLFGVDALWETDRYGVLNFVSSARAEILGVSAERITGQAIEGLLDLPADISQCVAAHRPYDGVAPLKSSPGTLWAIAAVPVFDTHSGHFSGFRGTLRATSSVEARPVNKTEWDFDQSDRNPLNLAHEIRTPLNAIRGFAEMIDAEVWGPVSAPYRHRSSQIMMETARVESLASDLLDAGRLEAGRLEYSASATDVKLLIDNALSILGPTDRDRVNVFYGDDPGQVWGDYQLLSRVVAKLVRTAACWTVPARAVVLRVISSADNWVRISADLPLLMEPKQMVDFATLMWCSSDNPHPLIRTALGYGLGPDFAAQLVDLFGGEFRLVKCDAGGVQLVLTLQSSEIT